MNLDLLTASIKVNEGLRLNPYTDTTGNVTIGYGRNLTNRGIGLDEAQLMLSNDIEDAYKQAQGLSVWSHVSGNDARSRAIVEIIFNLGVGRFGSFKNAIACLLNDDFAGAANAFLDSTWAAQVGNRAKILTGMIEIGNDPILS